MNTHHFKATLFMKNCELPINEDKDTYYKIANRSSVLMCLCACRLIAERRRVRCTWIKRPILTRISNLEDVIIMVQINENLPASCVSNNCRTVGDHMSQKWIWRNLSALSKDIRDKITRKKLVALVFVTPDSRAWHRHKSGAFFKYGKCDFWNRYFCETAEPN